MLACLGCRKSRGRDGEHEPLLPRYNDETSRQTRLHEKLHTYQMLQALGQGYMPSTEQAVHLRSLLSADVLNPDTAGLSPSGRALVRTTKLWLSQLIELLLRKNAQDQVQDLLWYVAKAGADVDVGQMGTRAAASKARADASATAASLRTIGSLLLTNSEFRVFLSDLGTVGREVLRDTASALEHASRRAGDQLEPSAEAAQRLTQQTDGEGLWTGPSMQELEEQAHDVTQVLSTGAKEVVGEAGRSLDRHVKGGERRTLIHRLKQTLLSLRRRNDYTESASALALLVKRYLEAYSRLAADTVQAVEGQTAASREAHLAVKKFWKFVSSFGDGEKWAQVEATFGEVVETGRLDGDWDRLVRELADVVQEMLTDPALLDDAEARFGQLGERARGVTAKSSVAQGVEELLNRLQAAWQSVGEDAEVRRLVQTSGRMADMVWPSGQHANSELLGDGLGVLLPLAAQGVQHLPVPRLEMSTPHMDLLLENLVLQPGRTVNATSFLPYMLGISTHNEVEVRKARFQTTSLVTSLLRVQVAGLSLAADEVGYWLRLRSGPVGVEDEGLVSLHLDERGIDVDLEIEIGRDGVEQLVTLRRARVRIHRLDYTIARSRLAKPLVRPLVKRALERKLAGGIEQGLRTLNRELMLARERLRARRIGSAEEAWAFARDFVGRLVPGADPDVAVRAGVRAGQESVLRGRYAPGSLVRLWEEEGRGAVQRVFEEGRSGWRSAIFDVETGQAA